MHTLAGYFREAGAEVTTLRAGFDPALLDSYRPGLVVLSPGPGRPSDFGCDALLTALDDRGIAAFGVCLGMQAMVEHAGGQLGLLDSPVHGKPGTVRVLGGPATSGLLAGLPAEFTAGRYHSLHARSGRRRGRILGHGGHPRRGGDGDRGRRGRAVGSAVPPGVDPQCVRPGRSPGDRERAAAGPGAVAGRGRQHGLLSVLPAPEARGFVGLPRGRWKMTLARADGKTDLGTRMCCHERHSDRYF